MTAYNGQRYLPTTIASVQAQTLRDFELIIVDDGSTDDTPRILAEAAAGDDRLRVISQANAGISKAANAGLAACRCEMVARIDADDLAEPERFEKQLAFMAERPDVVASGTAVTFIDSKGRRLAINRPPQDHETIDEAHLRGHCSIWHTSSIIRREAFLSVGGYNEDFKTAVDMEAWLRLGEVGRLANMQEPLQRYRLHDDSITAADQGSNRGFCRQACENAAERRGIESVFEAEEPWRPTSGRDSRRSFYTTYGWWAWRLGERRTALLYACKALSNGPEHAGPWRLLARSLMGGPKEVRT